MEIYIKLFEVLFPVFFVVGIGYFIGKKNPKLDTSWITNFAAYVGTPAMILYGLNVKNISLEVFTIYFWYYLIAIIGFAITGIIFLLFLKSKDIIRELPPFTMPNTGCSHMFICLWISRIGCCCCYIIINNLVSFHLRCIFGRSKI